MSGGVFRTQSMGNDRRTRRGEHLSVDVSASLRTGVGGVHMREVVGRHSRVISVHRHFHDESIGRYACYVRYPRRALHLRIVARTFSACASQKSAFVRVTKGRRSLGDVSKPFGPENESLRWCLCYTNGMQAVWSCRWQHVIGPSLDALHDRP